MNLVSYHSPVRISTYLAFYMLDVGGEKKWLCQESQEVCQPTSIWLENVSYDMVNVSSGHCTMSPVIIIRIDCDQWRHQCQLVVLRMSRHINLYLTRFKPSVLNHKYERGNMDVW